MMSLVNSTRKHEATDNVMSLNDFLGRTFIVTPAEAGA